ncbi:MAG: FtsQ-type POTRA domain-containing protein [Propionicimonas sp.]
MSPLPLDATGRLESRRRKDRRRLVRRVAVAALVGLLVSGLVWLAVFSQVLAVTEVAVSGTKVTTGAQVRQAAQIATGTPLVLVDAAGAADRVAGLPAVASVSIRREWPDRVDVAVTERNPRLAIPSGTGYLIADATGVVFDAVLSPPRGLIEVEADPDAQQLLVDVGTVYSSLASGTAAKVSRMVAAGKDSISLRMQDGSRVFWGSAEQSPLKAQVLEALLPQGGRSFDVSAPSHPTKR